MKLMAPNISIIIITIFFLIVLNMDTSTAEPQNFIQQQCQETLYFQLCVRSLSQYINSTTITPAEIARIALRISLVKARSTRAYIIQVANQVVIDDGEYQTVKDCMAQITEGVDEIAHAVGEFGRLMTLVQARENEFSWHQSNVVTWLSTATTDALACMNGIGNMNGIGGKTKRIIRAKVLNVAQVNSNALALINRFVKRHRAAAAAAASASANNNNNNNNSMSSIHKP